jgi:hypothetical protein
MGSTTGSFSPQPPPAALLVAAAARGRRELEPLVHLPLLLLVSLPPHCAAIPGPQTQHAEATGGLMQRRPVHHDAVAASMSCRCTATGGSRHCASSRRALPVGRMGAICVTGHRPSIKDPAVPGCMNWPGLLRSGRFRYYSRGMLSTIPCNEALVSQWASIIESYKHSQR